MVGNQFNPERIYTKKEKKSVVYYTHTVDDACATRRGERRDSCARMHTHTHTASANRICLSSGKAGIKYSLKLSPAAARGAYGVFLTDE